VKPSRFANRHILSFSGPEFADLKAEIASAGRNVQAIKVRPVKGGEGGQEYEIAFGHRRHRACLELGLPVATIVEDLTDAELFAEMERENRERQNLSPWEQGVMYKRALEEKLYPSLRKMAAALGAQAGNVSTAVQLASLPEEVVAAFASPLVLQYRWAAPLKEAADSNPDSVRTLAAELSKLEPKLPAKEVLARLTGGEVHSERSAPAQFLSKGEAVGFWDKDPKGNISVRIRAAGLPASKEKRLFEFLQKLFD
jgi:ParB family chromosome partitioning protein